MSYQAGSLRPLAEFQAAEFQLSEAESTQGRTLTGNIARVGVVNRNRRYYSREVFEQAIESIQSDIREGEFTGELDHPQMSALGTLERTAFVFDRVYLEDDLVKFEARLLDTPAGNTLASLLDGGVKVGMSTRGIGSVKWVRLDDSDAEKVAVVQSDYQMFGVDAVKVPSNEAGMVRLREAAEESLATHIPSPVHEQEDTVEINTLEELREHYPQLVKEAEDAASQADELNSLQEKVETLENDLQEKTSSIEELQGKLEEAQAAQDRLEAIRTQLLGEDADDSDADVNDVSTAVKAMKSQLEEMQTQLEESKQERERLELEGKLKDRFAELTEASQFGAILAEDVDPTNYESIEDLEAAVSRTERVAERALGSAEPGQSPGKGRVSESSTDGNDDEEEFVVTEEMLRIAGVKG